MSEEELIQLERKWQRFLYKVKPFYKRKPDLQTVLFLIGLQELGMIHGEFSKEEKEDLLHIGLCTLLRREGFYRYDGRDDDNWPHFSTLKEVPEMDLGKREIWLKQLALAYFDDMEAGKFEVG